MSITRSFIQVSKAWYAGSALGDDTERFDIIVEDTNWSAQFSVHWPKHSPSGSSELVVLDDAWRALAGCNDLISSMAMAIEALTPPMLRAQLLSCGFADATASTSSAH